MSFFCRTKKEADFVLRHWKLAREAEPERSRVDDHYFTVFIQFLSDFDQNFHMLSNIASPLTSSHITLAAQAFEQENAMPPGIAWNLEGWLQARAREAMMLLYDTQRIERQAHAKKQRPPSSYRDKALSFALTNYAEIDAFCNQLEQRAFRYRYAEATKEIGLILLTVHDLCRQQLVLTPAIIDAMFDSDALLMQFRWLRDDNNTLPLQAAREAAMDFTRQYDPPRNIGRN